MAERTAKIKPEYKRYALWGAVVAVLATLVVVFGGRPPKSESNAQDNIQGIIAQDKTREVSIGTLSERLENQQQARQQLKQKLNDMQRTIDQLRQKSNKIDALQRKNRQLSDQIQRLKQQRQQRGAKAKPAREKKQKQQPGQGQPAANGAQAQAGQAGGDGGAPKRAGASLDTQQAFKQDPQPTGQGQTTRAADGPKQASQPKIRTIGGGDDKGSAKAKEAPKPKKHIESYLPTGSILTGKLMSGMDAPTNQGAQSNTVPALVRLKKNAIAPNRHLSDVRECFVLVEGYGDLSSERVMLRSNTLSCVRENDTVLEIPMRGYAIGADGKNGLRGRLVTKQGSRIARSMLAGFASGVAEAFGQQPVPTLATGQAANTVQYQKQDLEKAGQSGVAKGASKSLEQVAQFYLDLAKQMHPVIEIAPGRTVDIALTKGLDLRTGLDQGES